ncbi:uncharacterized protein LOC106408830 [Brassica napus]|uniref:uncharacterized protein LOC106408830 n=1 Tax=Brassica napus TaxID=3708 RepID=UPI00207A246B|nr:uncharacterized protein LOC106408830 [Brassica napus]
MVSVPTTGGYYDPAYYQSQPPQPGGYYDPVYYQSQPPQPGGYYDPVYYQSQPLQPVGYSDTLYYQSQPPLWGPHPANPSYQIYSQEQREEEDSACGPLIDGVAMRALYPPRPTNKNILKNGGFEEEDSACGPLIDGVAMRALYPPRPTNKNILKNGGFEEGPLVLPGSTTRVLIPPFIEDDHSPLPGWMVESLKAVKYVDTEHFSIPQGRRAIELVVGKESAIAQVARTIIGKTYVLSFAVGDANNACKGSMVVEAFAGRDTLKVPYESRGTGGFKRASIRFVAVSTRTKVMFYSTFYAMRSDDFSSLCGPVIDDVKLLSVRKR